MSDESTAQENASNAPAMPEGFQELSVSGQQNWITKGPGVTVRGILKGRHKRSKGKQHFYRVEITAGEVPATFDGNDVMLKKGDLVCIDETKAMEVLQEKAAETQQAYEVWIQFEEKVPNQNDPSTHFWRMKVGARQVEGDEINF